MSTRFPLSLAAWSMHRMFFAGDVDQLGMARLAGELGFGALEMVNTFFPSPQYRYLQQLRQTASDAGVQLTLIMCDAEGDMAAADRTERLQAARNHRKWVDIAQALGCSWIRCNVGGDTSDLKAMRERAAESFGALLEYADGAVDVLIENHWGPSSDPAWLMSLIDLVDSPHFGTLPDFGNFPEEVDRYDGVAQMMRKAGTVSAKCYDFGPDGMETKIDFPRMIDLVRASGYRGWIGVEYEGERLGEREGILAARRLLEKLTT